MTVPQFPLQQLHEAIAASVLNGTHCIKGFQHKHLKIKTVSILLMANNSLTNLSHKWRFLDNPTLIKNTHK
jgi:hypothetical protein